MQRLFGVVARVALTWGSVRTRTHQGTSMECAYNLMTYGIPRNAIPVNNDGQIEMDFFRSFIEAIEKRERNDEATRLTTQQRLEQLDRHIQQQLQQNRNIMINNNIQPYQQQWGQQQQQQQQQPSAAALPSIEDMESFLNRNNNNNSELEPLQSSLNASLNLEDMPNDFISQLAALQSSNRSGDGSLNNIIASLTSSNNSNSNININININNGNSNSNTIPATSISNMMSMISPTPLPEPEPISAGSTMSNPATTTIAYQSHNQQAQPQQGAAVTPVPTSKKKDEFVFVPGPMDVIMGRGRHNKKRPGNQKLMKILESYAEEYENSDKFQKTALSEVVVSKMAREGSRFLVREGDKKHGLWVEISFEKARDKVAHDFRNMRRNTKLKANVPNSVVLTAMGGNTSDTSGANMGSTSSSAATKRRRSLNSASNHDQEHGPKRTHGIIERMGFGSI